MKNNPLNKLFLTMITMMIASCGGSSDNSGPTTGGTPGGGGNTPPPAATTRTLSGSIKNQVGGSPLSGIEIRVGTRTATTGVAGNYLIPVENTLPERVVVSVKGDGFATTGETIDIAPHTTASLDLNLIPVAFSGSFNPAQTFTAAVSGTPAQVVISGGSLVDQAGNAPAGNITAELTPIDPRVDIDLMPGDMTISTGEPIQSFGALTSDFTDAAGNELNLGVGQTAIVRIPVANRGSGSAPASIPLYYYDEARGFWVEEGTATLSTDGTYYEGLVRHFSTWNADILFDSITISGCVQDESGNRVANAFVSMEGFNYNGMTSTRTDAVGNFSILALRDGNSLVVASTSDKVSNTIEVGDNESTAMDVNISAECLILGDIPLAARLTWGLNPTDLDTHVIGPNGYHLSFLDQGSLVSEPFGKLDVDDITSFGPEVFTALRFPEAGTYHYAVHNFSVSFREGTTSISASPAKVELAVHGQTNTYFPPAGEAKVWWNVFDIIVDTSGNFTIAANGTWSDQPPGADTDPRSRRLVLPRKK